MKKILGSLILCIFSMHSHAIGFGSIAEAEEKLEQVMEYMNKLEIEKGFSALKPYWPLPDEEIDSVVYQTKQQLPVIRERFGQPLGHEKACIQSIADSWKRISYLQKFEKHTLLWNVVLYKPENEWVLNGFSFDDSWQKLFSQDCKK
ncbi:MAG: hypothetical protein AB8D52_04505 [Gammaproteobacteria bacterium]